MRPTESRERTGEVMRRVAEGKAQAQREAGEALRREAAASKEAFDFEPYRGAALRERPKPDVSVTSKGHILRLNRVAYVALGDSAYVVLLYDATRRVIGIRASQESEAGAFLVRPSTSGDANKLISCRPFLVWAGAAYETTRRLPARMVRDTLVVELPDDEGEQEGTA